MSQCRGVREDEYIVVLGSRREYEDARRQEERTRRRYDLEDRRRYPSTRDDSDDAIGPCCCSCCLWLVVVFVLFGPLFALLANCYAPPDVELADVSILGMAVQNSSDWTYYYDWYYTNLTYYTVSSRFNLTLRMRNFNTVPLCSTKIRRLDVAVAYLTVDNFQETLHEHRIVTEENVPLQGFSLQPGRNVTVSAEVKEEDALVIAEESEEFQAHLQRGDNVTLKYEIGTRYLIPDRRSFWKRIQCTVVATVPRAGSSQPGRLQSKDCKTDEDYDPFWFLRVHRG